MSNAPENELDLESLFLPAWAQVPSTSRKYAEYEGRAEEFDARGGRRDEGRGRRPPFGDKRPARRREGGERPPDGRRGPGRPEGDRRGPRRFGGGRPQGDRAERDRPRPQPTPLPDVELTLVPEEKGVDSLARQIRISGRAYPLFGIAQMILQKPERHVVVFNIRKNAEGKPAQELFVCALDDTLWLSEDEAVAHVLKEHFATFYQAERTATTPPKGTYTFVGQCGMSGVILGPPNHHDFQNQLRKLHGERFSRMPFETYKARVKIVRDPEVVKKWIDDQSWKTEYLCLNMPEPLRLADMAAVEKHFRETHRETIIKSVEKFQLGGAAARSLRAQGLARLVRSVWEDQRRFPLQIATVLSQQFANRGLQFFKVNKTVTHVSVARPHYLDLDATPVSAGVKRIVEHINAHPKCTRRQLLEALAPSAPAAAPAPSPAPAQVAATDVEGAAKPAATPAPAPEPEPTPEQTAVVSDLHWLIHQGHVIEFANSTLETAKKPVPRPPRPAKQPAAPEPAAPAEATQPEHEPAPGSEAAGHAAAASASEAVAEAGPSSAVEPAAGSVETPATDFAAAPLESPASSPSEPSLAEAAASQPPASV